MKTTITWKFANCVQTSVAILPISIEGDCVYYSTELIPYVPIPRASLVCLRDIIFSKAWQLSESDDEGKDTNQRVCE